MVGGAAVTEEIVPNFKFSRASYVLSLLRPQIMNDLELKKHGLKVILGNFQRIFLLQNALLLGVFETPQFLYSIEDLE